jgi:hypothetical protein
MEDPINAEEENGNSLTTQIGNPNEIKEQEDCEKREQEDREKKGKGTLQGEGPNPDGFVSKSIASSGAGANHADNINTINQNIYNNITQNVPEINLGAVDPNTLLSEKRDTSMTEMVAGQLQNFNVAVVGVPDVQLASKLLLKLYKRSENEYNSKGLWQISYGENMEDRFHTRNSIKEVVERGLKQKKASYKDLVYCLVNTQDALRYATEFFARGLDTNKTTLMNFSVHLVLFACDRRFADGLLSLFRNSNYENVQPLEFLPWSWIWPSEELDINSIKELEDQYNKGLWGENFFVAFEAARKYSQLDARILPAEIAKKNLAKNEAEEEKANLLKTHEESFAREDMVIERTILFTAIEFDGVSGSTFKFMVEALLEEVEISQEPQLQLPSSSLPSRMQEGKQDSNPSVRLRPWDLFRRSPDKYMKSLGLIMENGKVKFKKAVVNSESLKYCAEANWFFFEEQCQKILSKHLLFDPDASEEVIGMVCKILERVAMENPKFAIKRPLEMLADRIKLLIIIGSEVLKLENEKEADKASELLSNYLLMMGQNYGDVAIGKRLHDHLFASVRSATVRSATLSKGQLISELINMLYLRGYRLIVSNSKIEAAAIELLNAWVDEKPQFAQGLAQAAEASMTNHFDESNIWMNLLKTLLLKRNKKDSLMQNPSYWILLRIVNAAGSRQPMVIELLIAWKDGIGQRILYDYACTLFSETRMISKDGARKYRLQDYPLLHNICESSDWQSQIEELVVRILKQNTDVGRYAHDHYNFDYIEHPGDLFEKWLLFLHEQPNKKEHFLNCLRKHVKRDLSSDLNGLRSLLAWWALSRNYYPRKYQEAQSLAVKAALKDRMVACEQLILRLR